MQKLSLQQARKTGNMFYFTGKPCRKGHVSKRYVSGKYCFQCNSSATKDWHKLSYSLLSPNQVIGRLIASAKWRASRDGLIFEDLSFLKQEPPLVCPCCKTLLNYQKSKGKKDTSPSLDRFDNTQGYTKQNVHVICCRCNQIKNSGTIIDHEQIVFWMRHIMNHLEALQAR